MSHDPSDGRVTKISVQRLFCRVLCRARGEREVDPATLSRGRVGIIPTGVLVSYCRGNTGDSTREEPGQKLPSSTDQTRFHVLRAEDSTEKGLVVKRDLI